METIKNYLESMFANLPKTAEVLRAKSELAQMMEDKYLSLIKEGKSENEAVGTVITEFGNLDELAESLGIGDFVRTAAAGVNRRALTTEEVKAFLKDKADSAYQVALGVLLCITCVVPIIAVSAGITGGLISANAGAALGVALLFLFVAAGVGLFIFSSLKMEQWKFIKKEPCSIDFATAEFITGQKNNYRSTYQMFVTVGIILCVLSVVPVSVAGALDSADEVGQILASACIFILTGIGVFMLVNASTRYDGYRMLLSLNAENTVSGSYAADGDKNIRYSNKTVALVMSVYWPSITCLYLIWSFLSFDWHVTWIIWPVAAVVHTVLKNAFSEN